jgi:uncharacterized membrane protein HdeD (DUF308 family)
MDFEVAWPLGLSLGGLGSLAAFWAGKTAKTLPAQWRRILCALAALLAAGTAFPVALTGLFFLVFGATGYCEDYGGPCAPGWWVLLGVGLFSVVVGLAYLTARGVKEYRRIGAS